MTATITNPFIKLFTATKLVVVGFMFNSFWNDVRFCPEAIDTPLGRASGLVAFHDSRDERLIYLYPEPVETSTVCYRVTLRGGGQSKEVVGYSVPGLPEALADDNQAHKLSGDDGYNYGALGFIYDEDREGKYFSYCLSFPPDQLAAMELEITVEEFPEKLSE